MRRLDEELARPSSRCDIPVIDAAHFNASTLTAYSSSPLLVKGGASSWPALRRWRRSFMVQTWGALLVKLAPNGEHVPLRDFFDELQQPNVVAPPRFVFQPLTRNVQRAGLEWAHVEDDLELPPFLSGWRREGEELRDLGNWFLSVGATSSGQHFHWHGEAFNAVVWGRKRWLFLAPGGSVTHVSGWSTPRASRLRAGCRRSAAREHASPSAYRSAATSLSCRRSCRTPS